MAYERGLHGTPCSPHEERVAVCHALRPLPTPPMPPHQGAQKKGLHPSMLLPAIDLATLLKDEEENLKLKQINVMHVSVMELLGDPGNPLYAEPHSMAEHFNAMMTGAHAIGDLPGRTHRRGSNATARVYNDEAKQVCQKILRCLDMRVMDGDLIVLTCLQTPTLILPTGSFVQMYYDPDAQGQYASQFPIEAKASCNLRETLGCPLCQGTFECFPPMCGKSLTSISIEKSWREG